MAPEPRAGDSAGALHATQIEDLRRILTDGERSLPPGLPLVMAGWRFGHVVSDWVEAVAAVLAGVRRMPHALDWTDPPADEDGRSAALQAAAQRLRDAGIVRGWRGEPYAVLDDAGKEWARFERAAFRTFGCRSRAAHVHGVMPDGRIWVGRRAAAKATDPGRLDNLAAGGITAGEDALACAWRELGEEAGVDVALAQQVRPTGMLRSRRGEPEGLHDEDLLCFELALPAHFVPCNRDGEVAEFLCLTPAQVAARLLDGEFTQDAAAVTAAALLRRCGG